MLRFLATICGLCLCGGLFAQIYYSANDKVPPYRGGFRSGINFGYHHGWTDEQLAAIAIGDPELDQPGAGITSLRLAMPDHFLHYYDYDIRAEAAAYYARLGADENVMFIGYPSEDHEDPQEYCPGVKSKAFKNMFAPIWDGGANGTPVNDENLYAVYVYNLVKVYDKQVRFWEVMNEPDEDYSGNAWKSKEYEGNWFENMPHPCDYKMRAPIQHYVRMLRITYEVVKHMSPDDFVAVGGLGSPGFLDLIMRHTDNPDGGKRTDEYPHFGGAWFDAMSYHVYPHIDGQMRHWSNEAGGFVYERNSDKAADRMLEKKQQFTEVLNNYGYDGNEYPEKVWLITETNVPRRGFKHHGSKEFQRNYVIKSAITGREAGLTQIHWYQLGDATKDEWAGSEFDLMGLYAALKHSEPFQAVPHDAAIANRTMTQLMRGYRYSPQLTEALQLPQEVRGAAFRDDDGLPLYVLWARCTQDKSEAAEYRFDFPDDLLSGHINLYAWDYSVTMRTSGASSDAVLLTGDPVFIYGKASANNDDSENDEQAGSADAESGDEEEEVTADDEAESVSFRLRPYPNPSYGRFSVDYQLPAGQRGTLRLYTARGRLLRTIPLLASAGGLQLNESELPAGLYYLRIETDEGSLISKRILLL